MAVFKSLTPLEIILASDLCMLLITHLPMEPSPRSAPFPFDGSRRHAKGLSRFFNCQPAEDPQLNHPALLWVHKRKAIERFIQRQQISIFFIAR